MAGSHYSPTINTTGFTSVTRANAAKRINFNETETKMSMEKMKIIAKKVIKDWNWISNVHHTANKARIWLLWDSNFLTVQNINSSDQYITCKVESKDGRLKCLITAIYALNHPEGRKILWNDLMVFKRNVSDPWLVGGDYNAILSSEEKIGGAQITDTEVEDFQNFIDTSQLKHIKSTGCFFTWSNKQDASTRVWSRLDRILVNDDWIFQYTSSQVEYLMPHCSDHSPGLLTTGDEVNCEGKRPFKFFAMWTKHPDFLPAVSNHVSRAKAELYDIQVQLNSDLFNPGLIVREKEHIRKYTKLLDCENSFYRQKANIKWGLQGDKSTQYFHAVMKNKRHHNRVMSIYTENGIRITKTQGIISEFIQYYKKLLGTTIHTSPPDPEVISK
ncbi:uncharacterized protein LOC109842165 [Asparagus officinalis]|uniref:uncharacterized protein LOC109842165 n=1 Tax=Asparagus officinalis TaxID=4686 RepID=UPI00098E31A3|nr:uncharacterized protein LOC109842165 [Asparagus officinalis]